MESTVNKIISHIKRRHRGKIYFASDFSDYGSSEAVKKALLRLEQSNLLVRLAHGIYLFPEIDSKLGLGILYPAVDTIAREIARRDKARIVPTGTYALNALGLSTQVPTNIVFHTDGAPRKIKIYNQYIVFKQVVPKNLAYKSDVLMLVVSALKEIGKDFVTATDMTLIKQALLHEKAENIQKDLKLAPAWIRKNIQQILCSNG